MTHFSKLSLGLVLVSVAACGGGAVGSKTSTVDQRGTSLAANATALPAIALKVTSDLTDGGATNSNKHTLTTTLVSNTTGNSYLDSALAKFTTQVTVIGPSGATIPLTDGSGATLDGGKQSTANANWQLALADQGSAQGIYTVTIKATPTVALSSGIQLPQVWTAKVRLDTVQPMIAIRASVASALSTGDRTFNAHVWVANKTTATCAKAELRSSDATSLPLTLTASSDAAFLSSAKAPAGSPLYVTGDVAVASTLRDPFTVYAKCTDDAGNTAEYIQPVSLNVPSFVLGATAQGASGTVPGTTTTATYVVPGNLTLNLQLLDPTTGTPAAGGFVSQAQATLRATVTAQAPTSIDDLGPDKSSLWTQPFASSISFRCRATSTA